MVGWMQLFRTSNASNLASQLGGWMDGVIDGAKISIYVACESVCWVALERGVC